VEIAICGRYDSNVSDTVFGGSDGAKYALARATVVWWLQRAQQLRLKT
jgi:hypothetical protein